MSGPNDKQTHGYWGAMRELAADGGVSRRDFLKLLGASFAMAGVGACTRGPAGHIVPYVIQPDGLVPGVARRYATARVEGGFAIGLVVESHEGRPTKVDGNPKHPATGGGGSSARDQASVLALYDPDRAQAVRVDGKIAAWDAVVSLLATARSDGGRGLRFLLPPTTSPLVGALLAQVLARYPETRVTFASALPVRRGPLVAQHELSRADTIVSIDADPLGGDPWSLAHARAFAQRRRPDAPGGMNRLYAIEAAPTITGVAADHRVRLRPSEVTRFGAALCAELIGVRAGAGVDPRVAVIARDVRARRGVIMCGAGQPDALHGLVALANRAIGAAGEITWFTDSPLVSLGAAEQDRAALNADLDRRAVDTLIIDGGNPVYADADLGPRLARVPGALYCGLYEDETAARCQHFVPAAHELEAWGDARAYDGTRSIVQPLIEPLHAGRTFAELLALVIGLPVNARRLVREHTDLDDAGFERALATGIIDGTALPRRDPSAGPPLDARAAIDELLGRRDDAPLELALLADPAVRDGAMTNVAWLLELPDPITKQTWGNGAQLSPATAAQLGVREGQIVELARADRSVRAPVVIVAGQADGVVALRTGWGRAGAVELAAGVGANAFTLGAAAGPLRLTATQAREPIARTQLERGVHDRVIAPLLTLAELTADPRFAAAWREPPPSIYPPVDPGARDGGVQWAMSIDLSMCTGCSSCVVACQAENNIPSVGREGVLDGRVMHWLRIDTYDHPSGHVAAGDDERTVQQPMMCQHCETAPCEYVCPVYATEHSPDGLNEMIYNRCVGTRFCQNNCPYKVRRFNWFDWYSHEPTINDRGLVKLQRNPNVTVRERGVMEKCTYCVQRIRTAQETIVGRPLADGDVRTACQDACPTGAISFGSLTHADAEMVRRRGDARAYPALGETGARPRTLYLAKIVNPNPELIG